MDEPLFQKFKILVLEGLTVVGIRNKLGEDLDSFSDVVLVRKMVTILDQEGD